RFGLLARQKAVLTFSPGGAARDAVYQLDVAEPHAPPLRQALDRAGIPYRTLVPRPDGHRVVIYDEGRRLRGAVECLARTYAVGIDETIGTGSFLGAETRDEAGQAFQRLIDRYEADPQRPDYVPPPLPCRKAA